MFCKICKSELQEAFTGEILCKYEINYFHCKNCGLLQTENPYWLNEAYDNAITALDVGLVSRNVDLVPRVASIIKHNFKANAEFLDYAGGYGLFVRLMRDRGYDFYWQDKYCQNLFAKNHTFQDTENTKFELLTAFEVFEHLNEPLAEIAEMFQFSDSILFSTLLQPDREIKSVDDWWYFDPATGQHITFYSKASLEMIAEAFHCYLFSNGRNLHLITKRKLVADPLKKDRHDYIRRKLLKKAKKHLIRKSRQLPNLKESDYDLAKKRLIEKKK